MGGIVGMIHWDSKPVALSELELLARGAAHRGGIAAHWMGRGVALGLQAREGERQAQSAGAGLPEFAGRWVGVLDGVLDNREQLHQELDLASQPTPTDLEILIRAFGRWGPACIERLLGDFAFAIWDNREKQLFCARDPFGTRGFHYRTTPGSFIFATEAVQIAAADNFSAGIDEVAIAQCVAWGVSAPERSPFAGISQLAPGHWLVSDTNGITTERYWRPEEIAQVDGRSDSDWGEGFFDVLQTAVADCSSTTVGPIGVFMSGGLDSTSVAVLADRHAQNSTGQPVYTATYGFERLTDCSEARQVELVCRKAGLHNESVVVDDLPVIDIPAERELSLESPLRYWHGAHDRLMNYLAGVGARTVFTGHGGDRLLGGVSVVYLDAILRSRWHLLRDIWSPDASWPQAGSLARRLAQAFLRPTQRLLRTRGREFSNRGLACITPELKKRARWQPPISLPRLIRSQGLARGLQLAAWTDTGGFRRVLLAYNSLGKRYGVEVRHPFFDRRVVEFALSAPPDLLYRRGRRKVILREAMRTLIPKEIYSAPVTAGFGSYVFESISGPRAEVVRQLLTNSELAKHGIVRGRKLRQIHEHSLRQGAASFPVCNAVSAELWLNQLKEVVSQRSD